jgi:hypothetical protein
MALVELDEHAVAEVAADVLGAGAATDVLAVASTARGNPFRLVELLQEINASGLVEIVDGWARLNADRLPEVHAITRRRLEDRACPRRAGRLQLLHALGTHRARRGRAAPR